MRKKIMPFTWLIQITALALSLAIVPVSAQVKKCQDAQGKWHYGNDLRNICKDSNKIQSVKNSVKSAPNNQGESASDQELARLELKVLDKTEYLNSDLQKILSPYKTKQDVEKRFDRLKANNTAEIDKKEKMVEGLKQKEIVLKAGDTGKEPRNTVQLADINQRIKSAEADLRELQVKSEQIDKRRAKVLTLYDQFSDRFGSNSAS